MIALIDGDSIAYVLGWHHREHQNKEEMYKAVDDFLDNIFIMTGADMYFGALGGYINCFRYDIYKMKGYKATRGELQEHMVFWKPVILEYLIDKWKFQSAGYAKTPFGVSTIEADDVVNTAAMFLIGQNEEFIICSPDKDMKQIPGKHFDYKTGVFVQVDENQANYNFFKLMIEGDDTDNIAGIPGQGPKKAEEKLKPLLESGFATRGDYERLVKELYQRHFGSYYGDIIYKETYDTIALVSDPDLAIIVQAVPMKAHPFDLG